MHINYGYLQQSPEHLTALKPRLEEGRWAEVKTVNTDKLDVKSSFFVVIKVMLLARINTLIEALSPDEDTIQGADTSWDRAQRRYALELMKLQQSEDSAERAAADQLAAETLLGQGTAQTMLTYREQATFAQDQLNKLSSAALKPLVAQLKLAPLIHDIAEANVRLEQVLGLDVAIAGKIARSARVREAHRMAALTLNYIHAALDDMSKQAISDILKADAAALLKPLKVALA